MATCFVKEMHKFISQHTMIEDGETVLVAVSGGADSLALLYGLHSLQTHLKCHLHVVHLNHSLRKEADSDAKFVHEQSKKLGLPITSHTVDLYSLNKQWKLSLEAAGRKARYDLFDSVSTQINATKVALGHHQDDVAETLLMNLIRGTGSAGLKGIEPFRDGKFIRPILRFTRTEIENYLTSIDVVPRQDSTNTDMRFLRNRIRHELIPLLEQKYNPNIKAGLNRTADILSAESSFLDELTRDAYDTCKLQSSHSKIIKLDKTKFLQNHIVLQRRMIRHSISELVGQVNDFTYEHSSAILNIIKRDKPNAEIALPNGLLFRRAYQQLIIEKTPVDSITFSNVLNIPGQTYISELDMEIEAVVYDIQEGSVTSIADGIHEAMFDYSAIQLPLKVRNRMAGDRIQPYGMAGSKKIKDYLMDAKVPRRDRDQIPILTNGNDIMWIIGFTTSEKFKIHRHTQRVLHLYYGKSEIRS